ncbi:hypothetical protein [Mycobacterium phage Weirdo19]|uniref:Uncharacterized protein n=1 Tax=Mycobacterium phage Weirdo19 TaxID=2601610 RepID=A0A6M2YSW9_9CAUD|nr:hypothetical protein KDJ11_gp34 [Mycobacterium phage Weirdo19]QEA10802.1 hypothetical protein [Mycobacterium phage Weirdo19]
MSGQRVDLGEVDVFPRAEEEAARPRAYLGDTDAAPPNLLRPNPLGGLTDGGLAEAGWHFLGVLAPDDQ